MSNLLYNSVRLIDALEISSSLKIASSASIVPQYKLSPLSQFSFSQGFEYYLAFNAFCEKNTNAFNAQMDIYLSGSAFPSQDKNGYKLDSLISPSNNQIQNFSLKEYEFLALRDGTANLNFLVYSGIWYLSNVVFQLANWPGFNPDEATIQVPINEYRYRPIIVKAELYDINNNVIPTNNFSVVSNPIFFTGSNTVIQGINNNIAGTLIVAQSGSGAIIGSDISGSYIGIIGGGVSSSLPRPINPVDLPTYTGSAIITFYSGALPFVRNTTSGSAMGIQITDGGTSGSFLDYNTLTGKLVIRGEIDLLPNTPLSQSIANASSGSGALALAEIQALVNGSGANLPTGTFLNGNFIFSPIIGGNSGFFNTQFGVGNLIGGNGIVLTALGFTSSVGAPVSGAPAIYIGQGTVANINTPFIVASSSSGPVFSLADKLYYDPILNILNLSSASINSNFLTVTPGILSANNAFLDNIMATTMLLTGSLSASTIDTPNQIVRVNTSYPSPSGTIALGIYSINVVDNNSTLVSMTSASNLNSTTSFTTTKVSGQTSSFNSYQVSLNSISASYNNAYNFNVNYTSSFDDPEYVGFNVNNTENINLYFSTDGVNYSSIANWDISNSPFKGSFQYILITSLTTYFLRLATTVGVTLQRTSFTASYGTASVSIQSGISSINWSFYSGSSNTNQLTRYGINIGLITGSHIHFSPVPVLSIGALTAGDMWVEQVGGKVSSASLKFYDGNNIRTIV